MGGTGVETGSLGKHLVVTLREFHVWWRTGRILGSQSRVTGNLFRFEEPSRSALGNTRQKRKLSG